MRREAARRGRLVLVLSLATASMVLSSCAGVLNVIEDRLPPPHEVTGGYVFNYYAPSARQITLAGSFNNWGGTQGGGRYDPAIDPMSDPDGDGVWSIVVPLPPGRYQYKYVIDGGVRWERDPNNPDTAFESGIENSFIVVPAGIKYAAERVTGTVIGGRESAEAKQEETAKAPAPEGAVEVFVTFDKPDAGAVFIAGSFNAWSPEADAMAKGEDGVWRITLELAPGSYEYKFVVDGTWMEDPANSEFVSDPYGGKNSVLTVE
jgi:1,4-alpha-glucan branching enzyme